MNLPALQLLESFGDAHSRYACSDGSTVDVIRENGTWRGYAKAPGAVGATEVANAGDELELLAKLQAAQN